MKRKHSIVYGTSAADYVEYLNSLDPAEFDRYTPPTGVSLRAAQRKKLQEFVRLLPQDRKMLLYMWRFAFHMDIKTIRRYAGIEYANGIIEVFRFACKRYLEMDMNISDHGLRPVFEQLMPEYEMLLVSKEKGICWVRDLSLDAEIINNAITSD